MERLEALCGAHLFLDEAVIPAVTSDARKHYCVHGKTELDVAYVLARNGDMAAAEFAPPQWYVRDKYIEQRLWLYA